MKRNKDRSKTAVSKSSGPANDRAWLNAGDDCRSGPPGSSEACRLVLLGAPGVGKSTQAELLRRWSGACHLSTGEVFRAAKNLPPGQRSPAMESAFKFMARGELVPDATVMDVICEQMRCLRGSGGFLLDGFPRTVAQAEALERLLAKENLPLTAAIDYQLPIEQIVERLAGRRVCSNCKGVFQMTAKSPLKVCPACGGKLEQREDDRPEAIRVRMAAYHKSTEPLIEYYRERDLLVTISAEGSPAEIMQRTEEALEARPHVTHL